MMHIVLLVSLTRVPEWNDQHSAVAWLPCVCCTVHLQLLYNCTVLLSLQEWKSSTVIYSEVTSCSISLVACYKESLLRSITVFLNFLKLNFSHDRCVLLLHIFMLVWWGFICNEISILAALLHLVPLLLSRQTPVACSWVLFTGPHMWQGHRMGSSLRLSQGQEDFCWCLTPFLGIGITWLQRFLTLSFWDSFFNFYFLFVSEFETMSGQQGNIGLIFCKLIRICFILKTQESHYQLAFQHLSGPRSGLSKVNK